MMATANYVPEHWFYPERHIKKKKKDRPWTINCVCSTGRSGVCDVIVMSLANCVILVSNII